MAARKHSRQRDSILQFLMTRKDHPTADIIYMNVRQRNPSISLGTVYRNLTLLAENGEIKRLNMGDGVDHFDADTSPHYHLFCEKCGGVVENADFGADVVLTVLLPAEDVDAFLAAVTELSAGTVEVLLEAERFQPGPP